MRRTSARLLTALALLVGLLGMHALTSSHADMTGSSGMDVAPMSVIVAEPTASLWSDPGDGNRLLSGVLDAPLASMIHPWCVAVLLTSVVLLPLTLLGRRSLRPRTPNVTWRPSLASPRALRPPDLVAGLCVSRT